SNLEFLLLNHPLDCPICDKGGECPLQNQTMANGSNVSRLREPKRVFTKPIAISSEILLDRERCVLCQRCTRFSDQIAGDKFIDLLERGSAQQIGINSEEPFQSYFSGNTIQICPVGALTSAAYRFRARPFDLVSTKTVCEHCAGGCALRTDHRAGATLRRLARIDLDVNEEWNCDKGRFAFEYVRQPDRITRPLIRNAAGELEPSSWTEAMTVAARGLLAARDNGGVGVLAGGRLTVTDAYAYAKFARVALRTNDIDFRARAHSAEEARFLATRVAGTAPDRDGVTFTSLESAPAVLLVALEPEEESASLFLRLRKAARKRGVPVFSVAPFASRGLRKMFGTLIAAGPGDEVDILTGLGSDVLASDGVPDAAARNRLGVLLRSSGATVLVGERAAQTPGLLTAVAALVDATGAKLAWVPRRAGERGALDAGALGNLLPGNRPVTNLEARAEVEAAWGVSIPATPGRDTAGILADVALPLPEGEEVEVGAEPRGLAGLLVGGVQVTDLPDPAAALAAIAGAGFVVSLELRASAVTELADVVFPVAAAVEKTGAYLNWEGRLRPFDAALPDAGTLDEGRILDTLGVEMDVDLYTQTPAAAAGDLARLGVWPGTRPGVEAVAAAPTVASGGAGYRLASWRMNLDGGRAMDGEPHLAGTAKPDVVRISPAAAGALGVADGDPVGVRGAAGSITLSAAVTPMVDDVVWLPAMINGRPTGGQLGATVGARVHIEPVLDGDPVEGVAR
ncbi:MAG TPA: NADH-quinone oxidoreductase subunit G, partial [Nakamurella sp.]